MHITGIRKTTAINSNQGRKPRVSPAEGGWPIASMGNRATTRPMTAAKLKNEKTFSNKVTSAPCGPASRECPAYC